MSSRSGHTVKVFFYYFAYLFEIEKTPGLMLAGGYDDDDDDDDGGCKLPPARRNLRKLTQVACGFEYKVNVSIYKGGDFVLHAYDFS